MDPHARAIQELGHDPQHVDGHWAGPYTRPFGHTCVRCRETWPCETRMLQIELQVLRVELAEAEQKLDEMRDLKSAGTHP